MSEATRLLTAPIAAAILSLLLVPLARSLAQRTGFLDHPGGYKAHRAPTPYLGGLAVLAAFLVAGTATGGTLNGWITLVVCVLALSAVGTIDDRVSLGIGIRLAVQVAVAIAIWSAGLGWELFSVDALNLLVTIAWVLGIVNAFNLMDNQDGAAASVGAGCAAGTALFAQVHGDAIVAALALALAGACIGFLPYNLARPSKIFLGDGGSTPIGLVIAVLIMAAPWSSTEASDLLIAVPLVGIPVLDTGLVVLSRHRRQARILSGGRDHLTHRLLAALRTPARVALALACAQALLGGLALGLAELDSDQVTVIGVLYFALGAGAILLFDDARWFAQGASAGHQAREEHPV
jgi:UDP-GlcNAc:undecaprenyl-phosphate GlcNAc-1-phosphate transferase